MPAPCNHLNSVTAETMPDGGCETCLETGDTWVHLRYCVECGRTSCCDSSRNRHARAHAAATGHTVIRSKEPGERWAYCFEHDAAIEVGIN
jgi:hypothetical protein